MTTYPMHYTDNANSWRRILMLIRFYWPCLKPGIIICAITPFVLYVLAAFMSQYFSIVTVAFIISPIGLLMSLAPIMLSHRDYRDISAQLPVTAAEKLWFLILIFWIFVPALISLSGLLGNYFGIITFKSSVKELLSEFEINEMAKMPFSIIDVVTNSWWINALSFVSTSSIVIYYVVTSRHNRVIAGLLSYFILTIASVILSSIIFSSLAIFNFIKKDTIDESILTNLTYLILYVLLFVLVVIGTIFFVKLYKRLRNCGF